MLFIRCGLQYMYSIVLIPADTYEVIYSVGVRTHIIAIVFLKHFNIAKLGLSVGTMYVPYSTYLYEYVQLYITTAHKKQC